MSNPSTTGPTRADLVADRVRELYVFAEVGARAAAAVAGPDPDGDPDAVAAELTRRLQDVTADRHLRVRRRRASAGGVTAASDWAAHYAADAVRNAGGLQRVERHDARTGGFAIAPYLSPVEHAEPYVRAAFTLLLGVERLIIDVRAGRGGTPETVALICGYLLGDEPVHLQDIVERDGTARQYWTAPAAGRLPESVRVAVLTGPDTFSGGEELAYNLQATRRGVVVGARTGGGAHPVDVLDIDDELEIAVPVARSVNAATGTNWEGSGVVPDVECDPAEAPARALALLN